MWLIFKNLPVDLISNTWWSTLVCISKAGNCSVCISKKVSDYSDLRLWLYGECAALKTRQNYSSFSFRTLLEQKNTPEGNEQILLSNLSPKIGQRLCQPTSIEVMYLYIDIKLTSQNRSCTATHTHTRTCAHTHTYSHIYTYILYNIILCIYMI